MYKKYVLENTKLSKDCKYYLVGIFNKYLLDIFFEGNVKMMNYKYLFKKIFIILLVMIFIIISYKFIVFYTPFLIAYIVSLLLEPFIKKLAEKTKLTRKVSSIIVLVFVFSLILGLILWLLFSIFSEANNLLSGLNQVFEKSVSFISECSNYFDKFKISEEVKHLLQTSSIDILNRGISILRDVLDKVISFITEIPTIFIYIIITILATYFITSDKFYILDRMEYHLPHKWMKQMVKYSKDITKALGGYLKAEIILIFVSFIIVLIGLYIFKFIGMTIKYPILMAFLIMFVDALPILGSGTIMIPWGIFEIINKNNSLGFSILGLYVTTLLVRQVLEPKIVSSKLGIHPIVTLIAMYTGFKIIGILGLLLGPVTIIILKKIFSSFIEDGLLKSIFNID